MHAYKKCTKHTLRCVSRLTLSPLDLYLKFKFELYGFGYALQTNLYYLFINLFINYIKVSTRNE